MIDFKVDCFLEGYILYWRLLEIELLVWEFKFGKVFIYWKLWFWGVFLFRFFLEVYYFGKKKYKKFIILGIENGKSR